MTENNKPKMKLWKKILIGFFALIVFVKLFSGGSSSKETQNNQQAKTEQPQVEQAKEKQPDEQPKKSENKILGINDEWVVDGQWKLKILDVKTTNDRNPYSEKKPKQVVVVSYTYENIGFENDIYDGLFLTPDQIIDEKGSVGYDYPGNQTHFADEIPVGAKIEIAEQVFGLDNESKQVTLNFLQYDANGQKQKATFKVPVK